MTDFAQLDVARIEKIRKNTIAEASAAIDKNAISTPGEVLVMFADAIGHISTLSQRPILEVGASILNDLHANGKFDDEDTKHETRKRKKHELQSEKDAGKVQRTLGKR